MNMDMKLFWIFVALNALNVVIQTTKSLITVKCGKMPAAIANAIAFGLYTVVVVYMVCELPLWLKVIVVAICNFIGVYIVKLVEEKMKKDKLWKIELTVPEEKAEELNKQLTSFNIPHNCFFADNAEKKFKVFSCYCASQQESHFVKDICNHSGAKYFVTEAKTSLL